MSDTAYLTAKRTVDDRALNDRVFEQFVRELSDQADSGSVSVLDIGGGTGTMIVRMADREVLPTALTYRIVDREPDHIAAARRHVPERLSEAGFDIESDGDGIVATRDTIRLDLRFETANGFAIDADVDFCIAMALLDLVSLPDALEHLREYLVPHGILYAPITFDGGTRFAPVHPADEAIERCYHRHMVEIRDACGPHAGRQLLASVPETMGEILAVGGSTQIIRPRGSSYPFQEKMVLETLLETIETAIQEVPEPSLSTTTIDEWVATRQDQLERAELSFLASNLDVLIRY